MAGNGIGAYGSLPSDSDPQYDDALFADDETLYSQLVDDATLKEANWTDDWDAELWYGFDAPQGFPNYLPTKKSVMAWPGSLLVGR